MNIINKLNPISNGVSIIIHLNNKCNFKCEYCVVGRDFSKDYLPLEKIKTIIDLLKLYKYNKADFSKVIYFIKNI